jgi:LacI family transcriptional regulator
LGDRFDIAIPESTRERVRHAARQLGYRPHAAAQALASGRTNTISVAFPIRIGSHYAHVLQAIERQSNFHGYHMVATTIGHADIENVEPDLNTLMASLTDGVILIDMPAAFQPYIREMLPSEKPIVSAGVWTVPGTDCVEVDLEQALSDALAHLLSAKPKRLAFFGPGVHDEEEVLDTFAEKGQLDPRLFAYCRAMSQTHRPLEIIAGSAGSRGASMKALQSYISENGCPDALICLNDEMAVGANRALREMGYRVPDDVLLVGCDGTEEGEYMNPGLSTIVQPIERMCAEAWNLITNRLGDLDAPQQYVRVNAEFVSRGSSSRV